jgi:hypothetical protein
VWQCWRSDFAPALPPHITELIHAQSGVSADEP